MQSREDAELVASARRGDKEAFGHLVERYQQMARRVALGVVGNEDIAKELVQEAMLHAYLSLAHLRDASRFGSWLHGILLDMCKSFIRDQSAILCWQALPGGLRFDAIPFSEVSPDPQEVVEERELDRTVLEAVNALSPRNRQATLLFYYEQLSQREVAAILGISVAAVEGRLHKARRQLRERLLPAYSQMHQVVPTDGRRKRMVKVTVADVIRKKEEQREHHVAVLWDEAGRRILPIWIGRAEGEAIATYFMERPLPRPMTYEFMANVLEAAGAELEEVRIEALKDTTLYAVARLRCHDAVREVDARPSDAMPLALRMGSPIYVAEEVMERAGIDIPEEAGAAPELGKGLEGIQREWEEM